MFSIFVSPVKEQTALTLMHITHKFKSLIMENEVFIYDLTGLDVHYQWEVTYTETRRSFTYRCRLWWNKALNVFPGDTSIRTRA